MARRMLDAQTSHLAAMTGRELLESFRAAEGRTLVAEIIAPAPPLLGDVTNAELARAFGADLILLNLFDVDHPRIEGLPSGDDDFFRRTYPDGSALGGPVRIGAIRELRALVGRPVAVNLEPVDDDETVLSMRAPVPPGRRATAESALKAKEQGASMIVLTGNPATGVTTTAITGALGTLRKAVGSDLILAAGKMHGAGSSRDAASPLVDEATVEAWIGSGADIVLFPAPGTVPGLSVDAVRSRVDAVHRRGALAMTTIGTSQEGSDEATIRQIALWAKSCGADLHHIGDSGYPGIAVPENILAYSVAIRGRRHAWRRMASSLAR